MHNTKPLLESEDFPRICRASLEILQVNLGYRCNMSCVHCHVNAGPNRTEIMSERTVEQVIAFMQRAPIRALDLTGGAPEMNPHFRDLISAACELGVQVIDRCNLSILLEPGFQDLIPFLVDHHVEITASLPCYLEENVDSQRGKGAFNASIEALQRLNRKGYGVSDSNLTLNLVFNPQGAELAPPQLHLEQTYREHLKSQYNIEFNRLLVLTNMPIQRFGSLLVSTGRFQAYMSLLRQNFNSETLHSLMCRNTISIDWEGYVYDCDFNQMLGLSLALGKNTRLHISEVDTDTLEGNPIRTADHCFGCTAGQGSSCGGALKK